MTWAVLIPIIIRDGLPLALKLIDKWGSKEAVTPEEIAELRALAAQTPTSQLTDALKRAAIDPNSDTGKALLALVQ